MNRFYPLISLLLALIFFLVKLKPELSPRLASLFPFFIFYFSSCHNTILKTKEAPLPFLLSSFFFLNLGLGLGLGFSSMDESKRYTRWEEVVVSTDKGKREVHYYLKDSCGNSDLAVVGRERSLRHMTYETVDEFLRSCHLESPSPHCSPLADGSMPLKWKTRREVVDWLSSFISGNFNFFHHLCFYHVFCRRICLFSSFPCESFRDLYLPVLITSVYFFFLLSQEISLAEISSKSGRGLHPIK